MTRGPQHEAAARLRQIVRFSSRDLGYRGACLEAIELADRLDTVDLDVENLLADFIRSGPSSDAEADGFRRLAELYLRKGFTANGVEAAQKLLGARPDDDARELVERAKARLDDAPTPIAPPALPPLPPRPHLQTRRLDGPAPPAPAALGPLAPGTLVAARYELVREIGRGGMSVVFRARDQELGEAVALKFLTGGFIDPEADARFKQELRLSRQLVHPNIVRLYDIGQHHELRFLSMELLTGMDMGRVLNRGPLPPGPAIGHLLACCAALQVAHDRGIVHRDVKPANLFMTDAGELKVMDFGIAKLQKGGPALTSPHLFAGTPTYLAPEQIRGFSEVTPAADLYSLGIVAFEMLTGAPPFSDAEPMALLLRHVQDPPPRLRERNPSLSPELEAIVLKLLEKLPSRRYASCRELAEALEDVRRRL